MALIISPLLASSFCFHHIPFSISFPDFSSLKRCPPGPPAVSASLSRFPHSRLPESASDGPFLSNLVHIDPDGSSVQAEGGEDHCYSVLNATNALDVGPETRLPGRVLSIAAPSCQQQPNGLSIWDCDGLQIGTQSAQRMHLRKIEGLLVGAKLG